MSVPTMPSSSQSLACPVVCSIASFPGSVNQNFYNRFVLTPNGIPIAATASTSDEALFRAYLQSVTANSDLSASLSTTLVSNSRFRVQLYNASTDLPDYSDIQPFTDARLLYHPANSTDEMFTAAILPVHESFETAEHFRVDSPRWSLYYRFGSAVRLAVKVDDVEMKNQLDYLFTQARSEGKWNASMPTSNSPATSQEYWDFGVRTWFGCGNGKSSAGFPTDRSGLEQYDRRLWLLLRSIFGRGYETGSIDCPALNAPVCNRSLPPLNQSICPSDRIIPFQPFVALDASSPDSRNLTALDYVPIAAASVAIGIMFAIIAFLVSHKLRKSYYRRSRGGFFDVLPAADSAIAKAAKTFKVDVGSRSGGPSHGQWFRLQDIPELPHSPPKPVTITRNGEMYQSAVVDLEPNEWTTAAGSCNRLQGSATHGSAGVNVDKRGLAVSFLEGREACVRSMHPLGFGSREGWRYFEATVVSADPNAVVGVGIYDASTGLGESGEDFIPGSMDGSVGVVASSPSTHSAVVGNEESVWVPLRLGDVVGCGVRGNTVIFTRNGVVLAPPTAKVIQGDEDVFACVGAFCDERIEKGDAVVVVNCNFGESRFVYEGFGEDEEKDVTEMCTDY
ncbi:hypothetical protein BJ742DRAFT_205604 [Cladochytrium replicatum]|nr:hypothetical protein BJ742DRAFT_205604 [Cladochytrium replicatum]